MAFVKVKYLLFINLTLPVGCFGLALMGVISLNLFSGGLYAALLRSIREPMCSNLTRKV